MSAPPALAVGSDSGPLINRSGLLTIRVVEARSLSLPNGVVLPAGIQQALELGEQAAAGGGTKAGNRESLQRKQMWWLP